jgi:DNA-binding CsgD family transcriptional regulator
METTLTRLFVGKSTRFRPAIAADTEPAMRDDAAVPRSGIPAAGERAPGANDAQSGLGIPGAGVRAVPVDNVHCVHGGSESLGPGVRDSVSEAVLDALGIGIVVVDGERHAVRVNQSAREVFAGGDGLLLREGRLVAEVAESHRRLAALVGSACHDSVGGAVVAVSRSGPKRPFNVFVVPLAVGSGLAAVFISDPDQTGAAATELIARAYCVTESERKVVLALLDGKPPKRIASQLDLSLNTVKSHLRSVFLKLGVRRQVDLARIMLAAPPLVGPRR